MHKLLQTQEEQSIKQVQMKKGDFEKIYQSHPRGPYIQRKLSNNRTGLPDQLKARVEAASGFSMDDVKVHYNSSKPAQLQALAYTQGTQIYVGPGQEKHLGHEAWHVVQQKQGRVAATTNINGEAVNDQSSLEKEADEWERQRLVVQAKSYHCERKANYKTSNIIQRYGKKFVVARTENPLKGEAKAVQDMVINTYYKMKLARKNKRDELDSRIKDKLSNVTEQFKAATNFIKSYYKEELKKEMVGKKKEQLKNYVENKIPAIALKDKEYVVAPISNGKSNIIDLSVFNQNIDNKIPSLKLANKIRERTVEGLVEEAIKQSKANIKHQISDPIVESYEEKYKESKLNFEEFENNCRGNLTKNQEIRFKEETKNMEVTIEGGSKKETPPKIAKAYFDNARFKEKRKEKGIYIKKDINENIDKNKLKGRKEKAYQKEYVQDARGNYVPRYVYRALNQFDNQEGSDAQSDLSKLTIDIDGRKGKQGENWKEVAEGISIDSKKSEERADVNKQILAHQRSKEAQGGSPFISFTTTKRPIFGSTGSFFKSKYGVVKIDLAEIDSSKFLDTHAQKSMTELYGKDILDKEMTFNPNATEEEQQEYEKYAAARDAMRTREIVIAEAIPEKAIKELWMD